MFAYTGGLKGNTGDTGAQGDAGVQGDQGIQGIQGEQGESGTAFVSRCKAYADGVVSVPTTTYTKVPLNQVSYDQNSEFNTTLNRYVVKEAGDYAIKGCIGLEGMQSGYRMAVVVYVNNVAYSTHQFIPVTPDAPWNPLVVGIAEGRFEIDDYIELFVWQSGAARNTFAGVTMAWLAVHRVG